jgi:hypothetical protein
MIYTLTIDCVDGLYLADECVRVIEIDERASLADLHYAIQKAVDFDNDHLYEFYVGRHPRNRKITFADPTDTEGWDKALSKVILNQVYPLPEGLKLYYLFDFGDCWRFQIKKSRKIKAQESGVSYPRVIERQGPNPVQYPTYEE